MSLRQAGVSHSSLWIGWQQGYICPAEQSCWLSTDLGLTTTADVSGWCRKVRSNPRALSCLSAKTKRIKSPHNRCADVWATNGSLWTSLWFAPAGGKMSHRLLAQLSTGNTFPRWWWVSFHLVTGCSRTCYLQGVQPAQFLARLCLLAVQGGQELPSHPETKEEVKGSVCWGENTIGFYRGT